MSRTNLSEKDVESLKHGLGDLYFLPNAILGNMNF